MKSDGISPFAVESKMPIAAFDVLCLSMETLSDAVTIPWAIRESGIPPHAIDRYDTDPFVIMGGSGLVNPALFGKFCELCCFMSMQKRGRIVFGVEGASQRLRDFVSKNLHEEQILELMPVICRNGYRIVKFMMICGLPGETEADLDELYELAVKTRRIFERETVPGNQIPCLLITWMVLRACPHTPLQWAQCPQEVLPAYATFTKRIKELGFRTYTPKITASDTVEQLLIRADDQRASRTSRPRGR